MHNLYKFSLTILILSIFILCCDTNSEFPSGNFSIRDIEIIPYPCPAGETVNITAYVDNPDNEQLFYDWEVSGGQIIGDGYYVQWETPDIPDVYNLKLTVTGKSGTDIEERFVEVI
jgi:hypothetical protein